MRVAFTASGKTPPQVIEGDDVGRVKAPAKARHGCNELRNWSAGVDDSLDSPHVVSYRTRMRRPGRLVTRPGVALPRFRFWFDPEWSRWRSLTRVWIGAL